MLKIYKKSEDKLLNLLFQSKAKYGGLFKNLNKNLISFIFGKRQKYSVIDLKKTFPFLKKSIKLIKNTLKNKKKILIIGNSNDIKFLINKDLIKNNPNICFYKDRWINGLISNRTIKTFIKKQKFSLVFVLKSHINYKFLNTELVKLNIPIISILNINQNNLNINYPIVLNNKNIKTLFLSIYLIKKFLNEKNNN